MEKDYNIELLTQVIEYNHKRYLAFKEQKSFDKIPEFEKILNARCCKVGRIKRRLVLIILCYNLFPFHSSLFNASPNQL